MRAGGRGASAGNVSLSFLIVKTVALVLSRSQDVAPHFDMPRLIEKLSLKLYRQLHVMIQHWSGIFSCIAAKNNRNLVWRLCTIPSSLQDTKIE